MTQQFTNVAKAAKTFAAHPTLSWSSKVFAIFSLSVLSVLVLMLWALPSKAQETLIKSYGYNYFGNLKYDADYPHLDYVNPDAPKGGEISVWAPGGFDSFNPYTRKGRSGGYGSIGHESLMTSFADDATGLYCLLCETIEFPETLEYVIFDLRSEVRFADGTALTAEDVKFSYDLFIEQGLPSFRAAFGAMITTVEVLDAHRVKFVFSPDSPLRDRIGFAGGISVFSKAWFEEGGHRLDEGSLTPIMGTGAYELDSYDVNRNIVYRRRDDYWGAELPQNLGRNNFDQIRVEYFADGAAAFEAFKAGEYTFRNENSSKQWATGYEFPGVQSGAVKIETLANGNLAQGQSYVFNLRREKFQDIRVREAIGMMFNFEWSNQSLFYGLYERTRSFWGGGTYLEATGTPSKGELALLEPLVARGDLAPEILTDEIVQPPVLSERRTLDRKALRSASALLDEAGWSVGDDGLRRKDGEVLTVEFLYSSPAFDRVNLPFVANLERLGIKAVANRVDFAQEVARTRDYDFDMTTHSFVMSWEPGSSLKQWFHSSAKDGSSRNLMGLDDPAVDALVDATVAANTQDDLTAGVNALDRVLRAKRFWVPQWFKNVHTVAYFDQYEHPENLPPFALGQLDFWWFNEDKHQSLVDAGSLR